MIAYGSAVSRIKNTAKYIFGLGLHYIKKRKQGLKSKDLKKKVTINMTVRSVRSWTSLITRSKGPKKKTLIKQLHLIPIL